jgi:hypothetical protein
VSRYKVASDTQVNAGGKLYGAGEVLEEVPDDVGRLLAAGVVVEVQDKAPAKKAPRS